MFRYITIFLFIVTNLFGSADFNLDCIVNYKDFAYMSVDWLNEGGDIVDSRVDLNDDGIVDIEDLVIFASHWTAQVECPPQVVDSEEFVLTNLRRTG